MAGGGSLLKSGSADKAGQAVKRIVHNTAVAGWPSLACIVLFASGVQLFTIGILGQYLARTYMETKHRPVYIVRETEE